MKFYALSLFMALLAVEVTAQIHLSTNIVPTLATKKSAQEYLVEFKIEKIEGQERQVIAEPKMLCLEGFPAQLTIESEDKADLIAIQTEIQKSEMSKIVRTAVLFKENHQVLLDSVNEIKLSD